MFNGMEPISLDLDDCVSSLDHSSRAVSGIYRCFGFYRSMMDCTMKLMLVSDRPAEVRGIYMTAIYVPAWHDFMLFAHRYRQSHFTNF